MATGVWQWGRIGLVGLWGAIAHHSGVLAQSIIVEDTTLGGNPSQVIQNFNGSPNEVITGGLLRGRNLFHSFREFNVSPGRGVFFLSPSLDVQNILARVTGSNRSEILGTLGTFRTEGGNILPSTANLFLINPNGILFGPGANLNLGGSFVATTANALQFGDRGFFSTTNSETPSELLTINPSAFLFNQVPTGNIANRSIVPAGANTSSGTAIGLRVPDGHSLIFLGGDITLDGSASPSLGGGGLSAFGGRIELGGLAGVGSVGLTTNGSLLKLNFPVGVPRSDVTITNRARVDTIAGGNGDIVVHARNLELSNSSGLFAGIGSLLGFNGARGGDIDIDATGTINLSNSSLILSGTLGIGTTGNVRVIGQTINLQTGSGVAAAGVGLGDAGDVTIQATDTLSLSGTSPTGTVTSIISSVASLSQFPGFEGFVGTGNGGTIDLRARRITLADGAQIGTSNLFARGNAGNIRVNVSDSLIMQGRLTAMQAATIGRGNAGNIDILSGNEISLQQGALLSTQTGSEGNAGRITIQARNRLLLDGPSGILSSIERASTVTPNRSAGVIDINTQNLTLRQGAGIYSNVEASGEGTGGDINIRANSMLLSNGSQIQSVLRGGINNTGGRGTTGNIRIRLEGDLELEGINTITNLSSGMFTTVDSGAVGTARNIQVTARNIRMRDGSVLRTDTAGRGNAGSILIRATNLSLQGGSRLISQTSGQGNAGSVTIRARNNISFQGRSSGGIFSGIASSVEPGEGQGTRRAGNVSIHSGFLTLSDGAILFSNVEAGTEGEAGSFDIRANTVSLFNGAQIQSILRNANPSNRLAGARGRAGNINLNVRDTLTLRGRSTSQERLPSQLATTIGVGATVANRPGQKDGGNIRVRTGTLSLIDGGQLRTDTFGVGNAGNVTVEARGGILVDENGSGFTSGIFTGVEGGARGNSGDITILGGSLTLRSRASSIESRVDIQTATSGQGNAGDIRIQVNDAIAATGQGYIFSNIFGGGRGTAGDIFIRARSLILQDGAQVAASVFRAEGNLPGGRGRGGNIQIHTDDNVVISGIGNTGFSSGIYANTQRGASGPGGNIEVTTGNLRIADRAVLTTQTLNSSNGGNMTINARTFTAESGGQLVANTTAQGQAGSITLNITDRVKLTGIDPNFADRFRRFPQAIVANSGASSGLIASAEPGSQGGGGRISIYTGTLSIEDRATISALTQGTGQSGNIEIRAAGRIENTNGTIVNASSNPRLQASGGNITIAGDNIRLFGNSDIRTDAQGRGGGGNIVISGRYLVALNESDILAFSAGGIGGNITLPAFFGENYRPNTQRLTREDLNALDQNNRVDVNASGQVRSGAITTPDTTFIQNSLSQPASEPIDSNTLIANSCIVRRGSFGVARSANRPNGTLFITGVTGLPEAPGTTAPTFPTGEVQSLPNTSPSSTLPEPHSSTSHQRTWQPGDRIVEPQGVYQLPDGQLIMSRECS